MELRYGMKFKVKRGYWKGMKLTLQEPLGNKYFCKIKTGWLFLDFEMLILSVSEIKWMCKTKKEGETK